MWQSGRFADKIWYLCVYLIFPKKWQNFNSINVCFLDVHMPHATQARPLACTLGFIQLSSGSKIFGDLSTLEQLVLWLKFDEVQAAKNWGKNVSAQSLEISYLHSVSSHRPPLHILRQFCFSLALSISVFNRQMLTSFTIFLSLILLHCSCWLEWKRNNWVESEIDRMPLRLLYNLPASTIERNKEQET